MTIVTRARDDCTDIWCDGCGERVILATQDFYAVLDTIAALNWITLSYDRGYGIWYEHFCGLDCLDPMEWEED